MRLEGSGWKYFVITILDRTDNYFFIREKQAMAELKYLSGKLVAHAQSVFEVIDWIVERIRICFELWTKAFRFSLKYSSKKIYKNLFYNCAVIPLYMKITG